MLPIFITVLFALVSVIYVVSLVYFHQNDGIGTTSAVLWLIIYCAILVGVFLGIPATYDKTISETQEDYDKFKDDTTLSESLKTRWTDAVSSKNKYFISWFIALLYIPIGFHFLHRCKVNPMMYSSLYTFFQQQFHFAEKKDGLPASYIPQTSGIPNILNEIDKLGIQYSTEEKKLFQEIRESIEQKKDLILESKNIEVLKKLRYHIENRQLLNRFKNISIPALATSLIPPINSTFLYLVNVIIISVVCFYMFIYDFDRIYFLIPIFSCSISLVIYLLKGI